MCFSVQAPEKHAANSVPNTPALLFIENSSLFFFFFLPNITVVIIQLYNPNRWLLDASQTRQHNEIQTVNPHQLSKEISCWAL